MAIPGLKFNFSQLQGLDRDLESSAKSIGVIASKVLTLQLRQLRSEMRPQIPRAKGALRRSFGFWVRRDRSGQGNVTAKFGFMFSKRVSASTAVAGNVLQAGGAHPKKGKYLWIPIGSNRNADGSASTSPRDLISGGGFVATSKAGNKIAFHRSGMPAFTLKTFVKLSAPPLPIEARIERQAPEIAKDITESIAQVIEAKRKVESLP